MKFRVEIIEADSFREAAKRAECLAGVGETVKALSIAAGGYTKGDETPDPLSRVEYVLPRSVIVPPADFNAALETKNATLEIITSPDRFEPAFKCYAVETAGRVHWFSDGREAANFARNAAFPATNATPAFLPAAKSALLAWLNGRAV